MPPPRNVVLRGCGNFTYFCEIRLLKNVSPWVQHDRQSDKCYPPGRESISVIQSSHILFPQIRELWLVQCVSKEVVTVTARLWECECFFHLTESMLFAKMIDYNLFIQEHGSSCTSWWSIFTVSESFDVALILLCVVWVVKEQSNIIWDHRWAAMGV